MTTLLIVDDHRHIAEDLATTIPWSSHGVLRVLQAYSGPEALDRLNREPVDIVVTDIKMPVMSGLELIREIGARSPGTDCLLLTGHAEFEYARMAIELGASGYLMKPVRHDELVNAVTRTMKKRAERAAESAEADRLRNAVQIELPRMRAELLAARSDALQAAEAERERLVGDIHDIVGYALTAMMVQLEATGRQLLTDRDAGIARLEQSRRFAHRSLNDIRETLGQLRKTYPGYDEEEETEPASDLEGLIDRFLRGAERAVNIVAERKVSLPERIEDPTLIKALLNALQEGITNGVRHGGAELFRLVLEADGDGLRFELWNDGKPFDGTVPGTGLSVMKERIGRLGGQTSLSATENPAGTRLSIYVPDVPRARADGA